MGPWARAEAVGVVLAVWIVVRVATRRRVAHPWFVAFAIAGAGAVLGDARNGLHGTARYAVQLLTLFAALAAVIAFVEGLRRESGAAPARPAVLALGLTGAAAASAVLATLPELRAATVAGIVISAVLLNAIVPLARATRRRAGSLTFVAGIVVYALGRTAMVFAQMTGGDVRAVMRLADVVSIVTFGAGLLVFALEGLRDERRARAAVGHRPTAA